MGWNNTSSTSTSGTSFAGGFVSGGTIFIRFGTNTPPRQRQIDRPPQKPAIHACAVLGIPCKAPIAQVRSAYRRLAKAHHPDLGPAGEREERTRRMAELNTAYAMLKEG